MTPGWRIGSLDELAARTRNRGSRDGEVALTINGEAVVLSTERVSIAARIVGRNPAAICGWRLDADGQWVELLLSPRFVRDVATLVGRPRGKSKGRGSEE